MGRPGSCPTIAAAINVAVLNMISLLRMNGEYLTEWDYSSVPDVAFRRGRGFSTLLKRYLALCFASASPIFQFVNWNVYPSGPMSVYLMTALSGRRVRYPRKNMSRLRLPSSMDRSCFRRW